MISMSDVLAKLANTKGRNEKKRVLASIKGEPFEDLFKRVVQLTYDNQINFYLRTYPKTKVHLSTISLETALDSLDQIINRTLTGNAAAAHLASLHENLNAEDAEVLEFIIKRDLRVGCTATTFNEIWPGLIYQHPYHRCSSFSEKTLKKVKFPCFFQTKEDGKYLDIVVDGNGAPRFMSRSGHVQDQFNCETLNSMFKDYPNTVFQGEALVLDENGEFLPRTEGNGALNSDEIDNSRVCFVLWDMIPLNDWSRGVCSTPYNFRIQKLIEAVDAIGSTQVRLVGNDIVNSSAEIIALFQQKLLAGKEGGVIKDMRVGWKDGTSDQMIKCKIEFECELKVVGLKEGKGKNVGKLGALLCESSDGLVQVSVGGGYSDKQREDYFTEDMIGKIITVRANDIVQNKSDESVWSLFLPRHIEVRDDKTEADSYERVREQLNSYVKLLDLIGK